MTSAVCLRVSPRGTPNTPPRSSTCRHFLALTLISGPLVTRSPLSSPLLPSPPLMSAHAGTYMVNWSPFLQTAVSDLVSQSILQMTSLRCLHTQLHRSSHLCAIVFAVSPSRPNCASNICGKNNFFCPCSLSSPLPASTSYILPSHRLLSLRFFIIACVHSCSPLPSTSFFSHAPAYAFFCPILLNMLHDDITLCYPFVLTPVSGGGVQRGAWHSLLL